MSFVFFIFLSFLCYDPLYISLLLSEANMFTLVPDFYGEKISSVAGYRQWLKDQRAFNRKKTKDML